MESTPWSGRRIGISDFGVSAIFHKTKQKMAVRHCKFFALPEDTAGKGYMGRKDVTGKEFFADKKRFAELLNAVLYQGKNVVQPEDLELVVRVYPSFSGKGEMGRDVFMKDKKRKVCYGLELEAESDYRMPERVMVYDTHEYEQQIRETNKSRKEEEAKLPGKEEPDERVGFSYAGGDSGSLSGSCPLGREKEAVGTVPCFGRS